MYNYVDIKSVLNSVPRGLRDHVDESILLYHALEGYRSLKAPARYTEKVVILKLENKSVKIPDDVSIINMVTYLKETPTDEQIQDLCTSFDSTSSTTDECNPCTKEAWGYDYDDTICRHTLNYKLWLDSRIYNECFWPLRYIGNSPIVCHDCPNRAYHGLANTFSVDRNRILYATLDECYICLQYDAEMQDDDGNFLIIDHPKIRRFLSAYVQAYGWLERSSVKENGAGNEHDKWLVKAELLWRSAKGSTIQRAANDNTIREIMGPETFNQKLLRSPFMYIGNEEI